MGHPVPRIPVFNQKINFGNVTIPSVGATPYTVGTPVQLSIPGATIMRLQIVDTSGQVFDLSMGPNSGALTTLLTVPQGGGMFDCLISQGAYIWLTALTPTNNTGTTVTQGLMVINGYQ